MERQGHAVDPAAGDDTDPGSWKKRSQASMPRARWVTWEKPLALSGFSLPVGGDAVTTLLGSFLHRAGPS